MRPRAVISHTFKSKTEYLADVRSIVRAFSLKCGFPREEAEKIALAVDEACTNVIKHAYKFDSEKEYSIRLLQLSDCIAIEVIDNGMIFNPLDAKNVDIASHVRSFKRGGLGIHLIKNLIDEIEYHSEPGKRNIVRLKKYFPRTS